MSYEHILFEVRDGVARITLNRPDRLNSCNDAMHAELRDALGIVRGDASARAMLLTGAGRGFCAGQDLSDRAVAPGGTAVDLGASIERNYKPLVLVLRTLPMPVVCAVNGVAAGAGANIALACDIVIAAQSAKFALPEIKLAMLPGAGGTQRLPRAIGKAKAMDMCLSARTLGADEAERCGLVSRVVSDERLLDETLALAAQIAGYSLPALMAIKESVNRAYESPLSEGITFERRQLHARFASEDAHEGMHAFLDKRQPQFKHR